MIKFARGRVSSARPHPQCYLIIFHLEINKLNQEKTRKEATKNFLLCMLKL